MRHGRCLAAFLGVLLWGAAGHADITNTTPYDYDSPPKPGKERGTYMAAATGSLGPDCFFTFIGTAKYLPNPDGSGGKHCTKGNVELTGSGPGCAIKPFENMLVVVSADYTYNGDGTCVNAPSSLADRSMGRSSPSIPMSIRMACGCSPRRRTSRTRAPTRLPTSPG